MTLRCRETVEMPADIAAVGQQLLPVTNLYRIIGDQLADLVRDADFADLYDTRGRHALSPALLALVTVFQFLEDVPDREAAEAVVVRLDWKYALHLPLTYAGFDYTCLCYFRTRLRAHHREAQVFDTILTKVQALGLLKKRGKQRTASITVLGAVRQLSALETVTETLRLAVRALAADAVWLEQAVPASFREQYADLRPDYRLTAEEQAALFQQVGRDGYWLLDRLDTAPATLRDLEAVTVLRTVWAQRYTRDAGVVRVRTELVPCTERIVTPHDPGVRAGATRGKKWQGEKVHVTETAEAAAGLPTFITDVTTANASSGDAETLAEIRRQVAARARAPAEQYVDSGYVSGQQLAQSQAAGIELVGPPLQDTAPNGFKIADFAIDRAAKQAICPQGHRSVTWRERTERDGSRAVNIQFAAADCAACPLRAHCTTGKSGRSLHLSAPYDLLVARRVEAQTDAFRERLRARPAIEATLSELVRAHGLRRQRYRGAAKRPFENLLKAAACNLTRLVRALVARGPRAAAALSLVPCPRRAPALRVLGQAPAVAA